MKKVITTIAVVVFTFVGTAMNSDARPWYERGKCGPNDNRSNYRSSSHYSKHSQRSYARTYTQRYVAGYDCHGRPIYRYRTVSAPVRSYGNRCDTGYRNSYQRGYSRSSGYHGSRSGFSFSIRH